MSIALESLGGELPLWAAAPFIGMLLAVTTLELFAQNWWNSLLNKSIVAAVAAAIAAVHLLVGYGSVGGEALVHSLVDYVSFIVLLFALFVISGGIEVKGSLAGTPLANMGMLGVGAILANLIGTTGASMVLIRPFLRANVRRRSRAHLVVFFIIIVANTGGLLTPLGDPPLYLGFLNGVPFAWTLQLALPWLFVNGVVLLIFNLVDQFFVNREERASRDEGLLDELMIHETLRVVGGHNVMFLGVAILAILAKGAWMGTGGPWPFGLLEAILVALAVASYRTTADSIRAGNYFSFRPIASVAIVFFGIFVAMTAPIVMLNAQGEKLGISEPFHYFWAAGGVSSILDNAPTYLSFTAVAAGQVGIAADGDQYLASLLGTGAGPALLAAISCGAVLMGCLTYIGNGPNFMVKEIAEHRGIRMPNFLAYAAVAVALMAPVFLATAFIFFSPS
jgi:Na+/H+ antiporter NhaD/arsenite permease-like protein